MTDPSQVSTGTLGTLYRDYRGEMTGLARNLLIQEGVPESALSPEDVVQLAFTKALHHTGSIREPRPYLYAIIRREVRAAASQHRQREKLISTFTAETPTIGSVCVADFTESIANRMITEKALNDLPPQQRTAVWGTKAMDYTQAETAEAMGKSPGTIATHVARAVATLRICLATLLAAGVATIWAHAGLPVVLAAPVGSAGSAGIPITFPPPQTPPGSWWYYLSGLILPSYAVIWCFKRWSSSSMAEEGSFTRQHFSTRLQNFWRGRLNGQSLWSFREKEDMSFSKYHQTRTRLPSDD